MSEPTNTLRVEFRHSQDGMTMAALQLPDSRWAVLLSVPTPAYTGSQAVRDAAATLAKAIVAQMVNESVDAGPSERAH